MKSRFLKSVIATARIQASQPSVARGAVQNGRVSRRKSDLTEPRSA